MKFSVIFQKYLQKTSRKSWISEFSLQFQRISLKKKHCTGAAPRAATAAADLGIDAEWSPGMLGTTSDVSRDIPTHVWSQRTPCIGSRYVKISFCFKNAWFHHYSYSFHDSVAGIVWHFDNILPVYGMGCGLFCGWYISRGIQRWPWHA